MPLFRRLAAACLAIGLVAPMAVPAYAESAGHRLKRERHRAAVLDARAQHQAAQVAGMHRRLIALDARANKALEVLQHARILADEAQAASDKAQAALVVAQDRTTAARRRLDDMAAGAYRNIAAGGTLATTLSLVNTGNPETFLEGVQLLDQVGESESHAVDDLRIAQAQQLRAQEL